jgi:hypothetical protein
LITAKRTLMCLPRLCELAEKQDKNLKIIPMTIKPNSLKTESLVPYSSECQIICVPAFEEGSADTGSPDLKIRLKRAFAYQWNHFIKPFLKKANHFRTKTVKDKNRDEILTGFKHESPLTAGERVRVRTKDEILSTLDPFMELKGCAFLTGMHKYCNTEQVVLKSMKHFIDERDYRRKRTKGLVLLENLICEGTPVFGSCDRCCFLFWREEWLERL